MHRSVFRCRRSDSHRLTKFIRNTSAPNVSRQAQTTPASWIKALWDVMPIKIAPVVFVCTNAFIDSATMRDCSGIIGRGCSCTPRRRRRSLPAQPNPTVTQQNSCLILSELIAAGSLFVIYGLQSAVASVPYEYNRGSGSTNQNVATNQFDRSFSFLCYYYRMYLGVPFPSGVAFSKQLFKH